MSRDRLPRFSREDAVSHRIEHDVASVVNRGVETDFLDNVIDEKNWPEAPDRVRGVRWNKHPHALAKGEDYAGLELSLIPPGLLHSRTMSLEG
jgi:hypothetical protein